MRLGLRVIVLLAHLLAAATSAAGQDGGVPLTCQSAVWSSLPLASAVPASQYDPSSRAYYSDVVLPNALPAFVFACLSAALLLGLLTWRAVRACACTACLRGPRLRGKTAVDLLATRRTRWLRWCIPVLAAGVVAGAGFGFSTIEPSLLPSGVGVYEQAEVGPLCCSGSSAHGACSALLLTYIHPRGLHPLRCSDASANGACVHTAGVADAPGTSLGHAVSTLLLPAGLCVCLPAAGQQHCGGGGGNRWPGRLPAPACDRPWPGPGAARSPSGTLRGDQEQAAEQHLFGA